MVFRLNIHCCLVRAKRTHTFACEMYACMLTLCVHLLFKVLIIQFYVLLFTDKLQRVVFLIFSRNLCSTNLKSDYEYAFSQATSIEYVHLFICIYAYNVAKGKMHHNPILYCFVNMWARSSFYAIFRIVFVFFAQSNEYFYELKRFTMQRKTYCSPSIFMRMHMLNIWRIKKNNNPETRQILEHNMRHNFMLHAVIKCAHKFYLCACEIYKDFYKLSRKFGTCLFYNRFTFVALWRSYLCCHYFGTYS